MFFSPPEVGAPKCYAQLLGACSPRISREHIFTESVMGKGGAIGLRGFSGVPDDTFVGLSSATAKILCTDHNSRLSLLDSEAKKLSDALDCFHAASAGTWQLTLEGPLFERWLLKVSMGYLAAGHTSLGHRYPSSPEVVAALFGIIPMAAPIGMYSMIGVDRRSDHPKEVLFRELTVTDPQGRNRAAGAFVALHGLPFLFSFGGPFPIEGHLRRPDGTSYLDPYDCTHARVSFHPSDVVLSDEGKKKLEVRIQWP